MTSPSYGATHRGRVVRAGALDGTYEVEIAALAESSLLGPFESYVAALAVGDRVLLTQVGTSQSDLVIIGKLPLEPPSATLPLDMADVTGLTTALNGKQPLDEDLTAIAAVAPVNDDVLQRKAGAWINRTPAQLKTDLAIALADVSGLVSALAATQPLDTDLTILAGLTPINDDVLQRKAGAWANRTPAQLKIDLALALADVSGLVSALDGKQSLNADLTAIAGLAPTNDDVLQRKAGAWINRTLAQLKADLSVQPLDADLTTIAGLTATTNSFMQAKAGAWAARTITQVRADLSLIPPAVKSLDESVTSSVTFQDDDHLTLTLPIGTWMIEFEGVFNSLAAAGFKTQFVGQTGTTGTLAGYATNGNAFHAISWNASLGWGGAAVDVWFRLIGRIVVTTAGTFKLQWAQSVTNATPAQLFTGSLLRATTTT
jgi:hypothetical protein